MRLRCESTWRIRNRDFVDEMGRVAAAVSCIRNYHRYNFPSGLEHDSSWNVADDRRRKDVHDHVPMFRIAWKAAFGNGRHVQPDASILRQGRNTVRARPRPGVYTGVHVCWRRGICRHRRSIPVHQLNGRIMLTRMVMVETRFVDARIGRHVVGVRNQHHGVRICHVIGVVVVHADVCTGVTRLDGRTIPVLLPAWSRSWKERKCDWKAGYLELDQLFGEIAALPRRSVWFPPRLEPSWGVYRTWTVSPRGVASWWSAIPLERGVPVGCSAPLRKIAPFLARKCVAP